MSRKIIITVDTDDDDDVSGCAVLLGIVTIVVCVGAVWFASFVFLSAVGGL